jgi:hypothetical protein
VYPSYFKAAGFGRKGRQLQGRNPIGKMVDVLDRISGFVNLVTWHSSYTHFITHGPIHHRYSHYHPFTTKAEAEAQDQAQDQDKKEKQVKENATARGELEHSDLAYHSLGKLDTRLLMIPLPSP